MRPEDQVLVPGPNTRDFVVTGNLPSHQMAGERQAITGTRP